MKKVKLGSFYLDVPSAALGAVGVAVLSALPMIGDKVTDIFNSVRGTVAGMFNK